MVAAVSEGRLALHLSVFITWCDVTQVYSPKAIGIHTYACYLGAIVFICLYVLQPLVIYLLACLTPI
jgi:hypothetical protein